MPLYCVYVCAYNSSSNVQFQLTKYTMFEQAFLFFKLFVVVCKDLRVRVICQFIQLLYSELSLVTFEPPSNMTFNLVKRG